MTVSFVVEAILSSVEGEVTLSAVLVMVCFVVAAFLKDYE